MGSLSHSVDDRSFRLKREVPFMIFATIEAALTPLQGEINTLRKYMDQFNATNILMICGERVINVVDEDSHTPKTDENGFMWDEPHTEDPYVYLANLEDTLILATVEFSLHENSAIGSSRYLSLDPIHSVDI
ncbi:hypothetical protein KY284_026473 [Solanum tuberosum]|nr:hypothetical protein KY284_026473 [Solanum tuberosum]